MFRFVVLCVSECFSDRVGAKLARRKRGGEKDVLYFLYVSVLRVRICLGRKEK